MTNYSISNNTSTPFPEMVTQVKGYLIAEGFGILCEIDVAQSLKKKLNIDYPPYCILGACHAPSAYEALQSEPGIGVLLPCNVIIYVQGDQTIISAIRPSVALGVVENDKLMPFAIAVEEKLQRVVDKVTTRKELL